MKRKQPVLLKTHEEEKEKPRVEKDGRTIYFFGEVTTESACQVIMYLDALEREAVNKPITIKMNSVGGTEYDGLAIYDAIRRCQCEIITIGTGLIASMGVPIFLAGDIRYLSENCSLMNHQGSDEIEGRLADLKITVAEISTIENIIVDIMAERLGQSAHKVRNDIKIGDQYLRAHQALEEGYAHEILPNRKTRRRRKKS